MNPAIIEICAATERALNYMHTGHGKAISTTLMNPLWIGYAILVDGLPCFNPSIFKIDTSLRLICNIDSWPMDSRQLIPASASKAVQIYNYSEAHFSVSFIFISYTIDILITSTVPGLYCVLCYCNHTSAATG